MDGKSKELKKNYERLHRIALNSHPKDFDEPKVDGKFFQRHKLFLIIKRFICLGLWKLALDADFSDEELDSIKVELKHYENRIKKLRHLVSHFKVYTLFLSEVFLLHCPTFRKPSSTWWIHATKRSMKNLTAAEDSMPNLSSVPKKLKRFTPT